MTSLIQGVKMEEKKNKKNQDSVEEKKNKKNQDSVEEKLRS
jgi:hypothetical protein